MGLQVKKIFLIIGLLAVVGIAYVILSAKSGDSALKLKKDYRNEAYGFSLKIPEDFFAREIAGNNGASIIFEDKNQPERGFQITISDFDEDLKELTKERIANDIPDIVIDGTETVKIASGYRGITFKSDSPEFDGESRELWFVYQKRLFQLSSYERFADLLKAIFSTWRFF